MRLVTTVALIAGLSSTALAEVAEAAPDGKRLFVRHCARCHTTAGSGLPEGHPLLSNFEAPPADFTEPMFNSREPKGDWVKVVKYGGARMGLSPQMPAHGDRLTDAQIEEVVTYLGELADTSAYPPGDFNFPRPQRTIKAFPETELLFLGRYEPPEEEGGESAWRSTAYYGRRLGPRWQAEAKLNQTRRGDETEHEAELGVKWSFFNRGTSLLMAAGAEVEIPFEEAGGSVWIPYLSHASPLGDRFTLQGTVRAHLPSDDVGQGDVEVSQVIHWLTTDWKRGIFPGLEAVVVAPFDSDADWEVTLVPQLHLALTKRGHVALNVGVEVPLTGLSYDYRIHTFLLWDMVDGGFWEGW